MTLLIAGEQWSVAQAAAVCRWYGGEHPDTLEYYDFGGVDADPHAHDSVDLSDAGRLVVINANLKADDVPRMIAAGKSAPWEAVTADDDLRTNDWEDLLTRAERLYLHFRKAETGGLGPTRTHKLLHLKRPRVFPIVDSVVRQTYLDAASQEARGLGQRQPVYWPALAREIRANADAYRQLTEQLRDERVGRLTVPRLHDILVWSLHGRQRGEARDVAAQQL